VLLVRRRYETFVLLDGVDGLKLSAENSCHLLLASFVGELEEEIRAQQSPRIALLPLRIHIGFNRNIGLCIGKLSLSQGFKGLT
jgi:hypothetical protein